MPHAVKAFSFRRGTYPAAIHCLSFSPEGYDPPLLAAASSHGSIHLFKLEAPQRSAAAAAASAAAGLLSAVMNYSVVSDMVRSRAAGSGGMGRGAHKLILVVPRGTIKAHSAPVLCCCFKFTCHPALVTCCSHHGCHSLSLNQPTNQPQHRLSLSATLPPSGCPVKACQPYVPCSTRAAAATAAATGARGVQPAAG